MDNIPLGCYIKANELFGGKEQEAAGKGGASMSDGIGKAEGFRDETYLIVPTESFAEYMEHPLVRGAYLTDVGFFPKAKEHYREREEGADQYILILSLIHI